jgi:WD40 repeat protein
VSFLAFAADGKTLAYGGGGGVDDVIRLVEARTGKEIRTFAFKPQELPERMALSPDGKLLAVGFVNPYQPKQPPTVVWDTATGKVLREIDRTGAGLTFSPDGKLLVTAGQVWEVATGKKLQELGGGLEPAFSADGKWLALADTPSDRDESVFLYETAGWRKVRGMEANPPGKKTVAGSSRPSLAFSPDGKWLVATTTDGSIRIWEAATGRMIDFLTTRNGDAASLSISPDSKLLAVASTYNPSNHTTIWDLSTRKLLHEIDGARLVAFAPAAVTPMLLATGGGPAGGTTFGGAPAVRFWDPLTGKEVSSPPPHAAVQLTQWLPGGKVLSVSPAEKLYRVWDWRSGEQSAAVSTGNKYLWWAVASPDGKLLAISDWRGFEGDDEAIRLFDLQTGKEVHRLQPKEGSYPVGFTSAGRFLVASEVNNRVALWDTATGKVARRLDLRGELKGGVTRAAVSAGGELLVLEMAVTLPPPPEIKDDRGAYLDFRYYWCGVDLTTGKQRWRTDEVPQTDSLAVSADGKVVACGMPGTVQLRDGATGAGLRALESSPRDDRPWWRQAGALAFTPDGKRLIAGDGRANVFVWDVVTGKQLHKFSGHRGRVFSVSASADGTMIATGSEDSTILLWPLDAP